MKDVRSRPFFNLGVGTTSAKCSGYPAGWSRLTGYGKGKRVEGAALPERIYARWQSLAEPQTYELLLDVPDRVRQMMSTSLPGECGGQRKTGHHYRNDITLGLAPGGVVKVWVSSPCTPAVPVMCVQAEIAPEGPYGGKSGGRHRPLREDAKRYIEQHGIPYGSWDCDKDPQAD